MIPFFEIREGDGEGGGGGTGGGFGGEPPLDALPGLGIHAQPRYTCNVTINESEKLIDILHECVFPTSRMFLSQGVNGKIKLNNKKPVDWAMALEGLSVDQTVLPFDDVSEWVNDLSGLLLIDPHTTESEMRTVTDADYSIDQNDVLLTGSAFMSISGFAGCDGDLVPATATITVGAFVPSTTYNLTLDGISIDFIPSSLDSGESIATFLSTVIKAHPKLSRKFFVAQSSNVVTLTARFGFLTVAALEFDHVAPVDSPTAAPTLLAVGGGNLPAGTYRVAYAWRNSHGRTLMSPTKAITITENQKISVSTLSPPPNCIVSWFVSPEASSPKIRGYVENNGTGFEINALPSLNSSQPPDLNRSGTECLRVRASFTDRELVRADASQSNVIRGTFEWLLGSREKPVNRIDFKYRDSAQDWRLIELRVKDDEHIAKTKKISNLEINGQGVDNYFQSLRLAIGYLAEQRDADFFYQWTATRSALLLEEGDVVGITDRGSGVINFPVSIESIEFDISSSGLPTARFVGRKYANTLYDDSIVDYTIPVLPTPLEGAPTDAITYLGEYITIDGDYITYAP